MFLIDLGIMVNDLLKITGDKMKTITISDKAKDNLIKIKKDRSAEGRSVTYSEIIENLKK